MKYDVLERKSTYTSDYIGQDIYNFLDKTFVIPKDFTFNLIKVNFEYIARPDLLSIDLYGTDDYTDILCKINGISNPFELNEDTTLVCPTIDSISSFCVDSNNNEKETGGALSNAAITPTSKKKTEKRKSNAAIVGDQRFTVDVNNRVIIY